MRTRVILVDDCGDGVKREIMLSEEESLNYLVGMYPSKPRGFWRTLWDFLFRGRVS